MTEAGFMVMMGLDKFYGRKDILELLKKRVLDFKDGYRQNIALLGERYIGKTSVLHKFLESIELRSIIPVYVDLENRELGQFCERISSSLLYQFLRSRGQSCHEDLKLLLESVQDSLPLTVKSIRRIQAHLAHGRQADAYREVIALPQTFSSETGLFCVLMLDEFQALDDWDIPDVFRDLGKTIMTQKQCLYIVSSSLPSVAETILSEKLSLLFGNFEVRWVEPFSIRTCQEFIVAHLQSVQISDSLRDFLIDFTGRRPLYLKLLCHELRTYCSLHGQGEVFVPVLTEAVKSVLFNPWGVLSRHFDLFMDALCFKGNVLNARILLVLSNGKQKLKDIAHLMNVKQSLISPRISRLIEGGHVVKNGKFFYIDDRLFRYWLKFVFQKRQQAIEYGLERQMQDFEKEFIAIVEHFQVTNQKDVQARIIELFNCFDDEAVQMNGRRYKLPVFQRLSSIKRLDGAADPFAFIEARTSSGNWCVVLTRRSVQEQEIANIAAHLKKRNQKLERCVLIALEDLDENVRVRALQERMWIWNENELNTLLNIYDQSYIV